jgi:DnaJ like chaperone protein
MAIWQRIAGFAGGSIGVVGAFLDRIATAVVGTRDPEARRQFAFSMSMIALSAKMAKADGIVTRDEVAAFRRMFHFPPEETRNVERLFNLARRDVAGFELYASRLAALYEPGDSILGDIVDGLFGIARADSFVHEAEIDYLAEVARRFGLADIEFERIKARHVIPEEGDPYAILGFDRSLDFDELRRAYRRLAGDGHPDRLLARGVPPEFVAIANQRLAAINAAWDRIEAERRPR